MRRRLGALTAAVALTGSLTAAGPAAAAGSFTTSYETIRGDGGTAIKALVFRPKGKGPFPLIVLPSSWAIFHAEYAGAAAKWSAAGYQVIAYTSRGFWDSDGHIEVAGRPDVADLTKVIDWGVAHGGDPDRVGAGGISYGAGIALLGAAFDKRIKAVAAMSAWASLEDSLFLNETVSEQAAAMLLGVGHLTGRPGDDLLTVQDGYLKDEFGTAIPLARVRGAGSYLPRVNANGAAILITNGWQDGLFPPAQITDFFTRLTTPKRLVFTPGDHGTADLTGAVGLPNASFTAARRWFDHYLRGVDNGADREGQVGLTANNGGGQRNFPDWRAVSAKTLRYTLRTSRTMDRGRAAWRQKIATGRGTVADSGVVEVSGLAAQAGIHWKIKTSEVDRRDALLIRGPKLRRTTTLSGFPVLRATVTPSAKNTSLFAYVYDEAPGGNAVLVTHVPYSLRNAVPGRAVRLDLRLQPIRWTLKPGHRFTLVVDTVDLRYRTTSKTGGSLTFAGSADAPATLTLPIG
ncbi:CocE/NonD family hydrolase [Actinocorallia lasiicapitis]